MAALRRRVRLRQPGEIFRRLEYKIQVETYMLVHTNSAGFTLELV